MNNTIQNIIEMDKAARSRIGKAEAQAKKIAEDTEKKLSNLKKTEQARSEAQISKDIAEIKKDADAEIERITADADEKCRRLDSVMKKQSDAMCREIVERIFSGADNG